MVASSPENLLRLKSFQDHYLGQNKNCPLCKEEMFFADEWWCAVKQDVSMAVDDVNTANIRFFINEYRITYWICNPFLQIEKIDKNTGYCSMIYYDENISTDLYPEDFLGTEKQIQNFLLIQ